MQATYGIGGHGLLMAMSAACRVKVTEDGELIILLGTREVARIKINQRQPVSPAQQHARLTSGTKPDLPPQVFLSLTLTALRSAYLRSTTLSLQTENNERFAACSPVNADIGHASGAFWLIMHLQRPFPTIAATTCKLPSRPVSS